MGGQAMDGWHSLPALLANPCLKCGDFPPPSRYEIPSSRSSHHARQLPTIAADRSSQPVSVSGGS